MAATGHQSVSVCMATYNGSPFIQEQVLSILEQTVAVDEIIIVDDASSDNTIDLLRSFSDPRFVLLQNEINIGVVRSFEKSLMHATGDLILLCDQDDIWRRDKVERFKQLFELHADVTMVISDASVIGANGELLRESWFGSPHSMPGLLSNLMRNRYTGCLLGMRRAVLAHCLPIPPRVPMHDMWIGMLCQLYGRIGYLPEPLVGYRRHTSNVSSENHAPLPQMMAWRFWLLWQLAKRLVLMRFNTAPEPRL